MHQIRRDNYFTSSCFGFQLTLHAATGNTEEEKCYETFHTFKLSMGLLTHVKM